MFRKFKRWLKSFFVKPTVNAPRRPERIERQVTVEVEESKIVLKEGLGRDVNSRGLALIIHSEGFYSKPYKCPAGVPTIGFGTTYYPNGTKVKLTDKPIGRALAIEYLRAELDEKEEALEKALKKLNFKANSNQYSALVSFVYNLGLGPVVTEGRSMHDALKRREINGIAAAFMEYNKARVGIFRRLKVLNGLTIRRRAERDLFLSNE